MKKKMDKAHLTIYRLLKEGGRQSELNDIVEYIISAMICLNVILIIFESVGVSNEYSSVITVIRNCFFIFFLTEYIMRLWIADFVMQDKKHPVKSRLRYMVSFRAIIDLLALLPVMLGSTIVDFRIFRVLRLLRITQLKSLRRYTETLSKVVKLKYAELLASLFFVVIFILVAAVIIYDLENKAQPDVFQNVLSGLWWSISAITTIGYGDMYPITPLGKILASFMSVAGVFLMAFPIGILTSGFFELSKDQKNSEESKNPPESDE